MSEYKSERCILTVLHWFKIAHFYSHVSRERRRGAILVRGRLWGDPHTEAQSWVSAQCIVPFPST